MKHHVLHLLAITATIHASAQSTSDCAGAITLCGGVYTESASPSGTGAAYEFTGTCNANLETASLWYTFTVAEPGSISFILDPATDSDDYDWGLFNITNGGCAGITAQDGSSPEVSCNSYGNFDANGPTGISTANGGSGNSNGPGNLNGPVFNGDLPVQVGETYALVVMNWSNSPDGYTIDFTQSTASIFDSSVPTVVATAFDCSNTYLHIEFSEPMRTSTVEPADFVITSPSGTTSAFTSVAPDAPGAMAQQGFTASLAQGLAEPGTYELLITFVSGNVEDVCGNTVVDTLIEVEVGEPLRYAVDISPACNAANGSIAVEHLAGGVAPVTFTVDGQPLVGDAASGLALGNHTLVVQDGGGCVITETLSVPNHAIFLQIQQAQDSLSCTQPQVVIQGVSVQPFQTVQYTWSAVSEAGTPLDFSSNSSTPGATQPGTYTLLVTEPISGCTDDATVTIHRTEQPTVDLGAVILPNVVTPNGDGQNDTWRPYTPQMPGFDLSALFDEYQLTVTNRWGQEVFRSAGSQRTWNARDAADGTYFYTVRYKGECGTVIDAEQTGSITVIR